MGITAIKIRAWALASSGLKHKEIGRVLNRTEMTVGTYVRDVNVELCSDINYSKAQLDVKKMITPAMRNLQKYLTGKLGGNKERYDATMRILESADLIKKYHRGGAMAETVNQQITALNCDIVVNPEKDEEFARGAPEQIRRIIRAIEQSPPGQKIEGFGPP